MVNMQKQIIKILHPCYFIRDLSIQFCMQKLGTQIGLPMLPIVKTLGIYMLESLLISKVFENLFAIFGFTTEANQPVAINVSKVFLLEYFMMPSGQSS